MSAITRGPLVAVFLCVALVLIAGCASTTPSPAATPPVTTTVLPTSPPVIATTAPVVVEPTEKPLVWVKNQSVSTTPILPVTGELPALAATVTTAAPVNTTAHDVNQPVVNATVTGIQADIPRTANLLAVKNYFPVPIPNCTMGVVFPAIVNDPGYGLAHPVPKIIALSPAEYQVFLRDYTVGSSGQTQLSYLPQCQGLIADPQWNFVKVSAMVNPTNVRPANYTVTLNVRSRGKLASSFSYAESLSLNNPVSLNRFIPLRISDLDQFDSVDITYEKQPL